jgi:hypothetical protein
LLDPAGRDGPSGSRWQHTATTYFDGTFNVIANRLADENGGVLSHAEADRRVAATEDWREARAFFDGL